MAIVYFACNQGQKPKPELLIDFRKLRKAVQDSSGNLILGTPERHVALKYSYSGSMIDDTFDSTSMKLMAGKMPEMATEGPLQVMYKNSADSVIGSYYFSKSPFYLNVETGDKGLKRMTKGYFYVRLPKDSTISTVTLFEDGVQISESNVSTIFSNL